MIYNVFCLQSAQLKNETLNYEEKEQTLVNDACKHLGINFVLFSVKNYFLFLF